MSNETFPFRVGTFNCQVVSDGTFAYPFPTQNVFINFFVNAPKESLRRALKPYTLDPDRWEQAVIPYLCLVIDTGAHRVLVDTGAGSFAPTTGRLIPNLKAAGHAPEDIDTVILTHCHLDHVNGNLDTEGKPMFPKAQYVILQEEWEFWTSEQAVSTLAELTLDDHLKDGLITFARNNLLPIREYINSIEPNTIVVPGIQALTAPGHTPGHMVVAVTSENEHLLVLSDMVLHPLHLEQPDWHLAVATAPETIGATRRRFLDRAASQNALVHAFHFPFPGLGHVVRWDKTWQWQSLPTTS